MTCGPATSQRHCGSSGRPRAFVPITPGLGGARQGGDDESPRGWSCPSLTADSEPTRSRHCRARAHAPALGPRLRPTDTGGSQGSAFTSGRRRTRGCGGGPHPEGVAEPVAGGAEKYSHSRPQAGANRHRPTTGGADCQEPPRGMHTCAGPERGHSSRGTFPFRSAPSQGHSHPRRAPRTARPQDETWALRAGGQETLAPPGWSLRPRGSHLQAESQEDHACPGAARLPGTPVPSGSAGGRAGQSTVGVLPTQDPGAPLNAAPRTRPHPGQGARLQEERSTRPTWTKWAKER